MMARTLIADLVDELERGRFFGSLELKFEAGQVVLVRKTVTSSPPMRSAGAPQERMMAATLNDKQTAVKLMDEALAKATALKEIDHRVVAYRLHR